MDHRLTRPQRRALRRLADLDRSIDMDRRAFGASPRGVWLRFGPTTPTTATTARALRDRRLVRLCTRPRGLGPNEVPSIARVALDDALKAGTRFESWFALTDEGREVARKARL